jgi:hypothetical protein
MLVIPGQKSIAQILDDSTRQIYGTHSTFYVLEEDILNNKKTSNNIDTAFGGFHNYGLMYQGENVYQNLGNLGTASASIYYQPPSQIGKTLGFNSFNNYAVDPNRVKYYDTRSPFTSLYYVQGSRGQQILEGEFSRNISKQWNIGFDIKTVSSRKIIGQTAVNTSTDIRQTNFISIILSTRYFTKDERYQLLSNVTWVDGKNKENGGVKPYSATEPRDSLFDLQVSTANLNFARNLEKRFNYHLYQQLSPFSSKTIQLYDIFDYQARNNRYTDALNTVDSTFYQSNYSRGISPASTGNFDINATNDKTLFHLVENKLGIKGSIGAISYRAYWRKKYFTYNQSYQQGLGTITAYNRIFTEDFVGAAASYNFNDSLSRVFVAGEYYIGGNDYFLKADYKGKLFNAGIHSIQYSPSLVQKEYVGNHFVWGTDAANRFSSTNLNNAWLGADIKLGNLEIKPSVNYLILHNYIYYDTLARPAQTSSPINIVYANLSFKVYWKSMHLENLTRYTKVSGTGAAYINMPELYNHTRIYHQNHFFENNLHIQVGFDFFWRSAYYANYYMPVTQQFYLNNSFPVNSYWLSDFFIDFQIKKVNFFLKLTNATIGLFPEKGYFTTPYYPGMGRTFEFGLKWMFFN